MERVCKILALLALPVLLWAQTAPSGYTTNYNFRRWAQGANPGADSLNANWNEIDASIFSAKRGAIWPAATSTHDLGTTSLRWDSAFVNYYIGTTLSLSGALSATGATYSGLTASRLVATDGSKNLVSTITSANLALSISDETGSGLAVFNTSPNFATSLSMGGTTFLSGLNLQNIGTISTTGNISTAGAYTGTVTNGIVQITGHDAAGSGGNILLYGGAHATDASDIWFRGGTTVRLKWDNSVPAWDFQSTNLSNIGTISSGAITAGGKISSTATGTTFESSVASAGSWLALNLRNTSNTASSTANIWTGVGGASASDALIGFGITGVGAWAVGLDNDDGDAFSIGWTAATSSPLTIPTSLFKITTTGAATFAGAITSSGTLGGALIADTSSFTTTATRKAVFVSGITTSDKFAVSHRNITGDDTLPVAGDQLSYYVKTDSLIVLRAAGTTSGQKFSYIRIR